VSRGKAVTVRGTSASASRLSARSTYTFAVFTKVKKKWVGPVSVTVTTPSTTTGVGAQVRAEGAVIATAGQVRASVTGGKVTSTLPSGVTPVLGNALVLPVSSALPGGFVGRITSIATDGKTVTLEQTGLDDVFDLYVSPSVSLNGSKASLTPASRTELFAGTTSRLLRQRAAAAVRPVCASVASLEGPAFTIEGDPTNRFSFTVKSEEIDYFPDIPVGVEGNLRLVLDFAYGYQTGWDLAAACGFEVSFLDWKSSATMIGGIPFMTTVSSKVAVTYSGKVEASHGGGVTSLGIEGSFALGETSGTTELHKVSDYVPTPDAAKGTGSVNFDFSGTVGFGPGIGSSAAGVTAGLQSVLTPLSAQLGYTRTVGNDKTCLILTAGAKAKFGLYARGWLGWSSHTFELNAIDETWNYLTEEKYPAGCDRPEDKEPTEDEQPPEVPEDDEPIPDTGGDVVDETGCSDTGFYFELDSATRTATLAPGPHCEPPITGTIPSWIYNSHTNPALPEDQRGEYQVTAIGDNALRFSSLTEIGRAHV
jgi:hypothetical protein